jgi:hypothetical protein
VLLPPGWLPLGAMAAAEDNLLPPLLGMLGMGGIGVASLWRAYRTTIRLYTGQFTSGKKQTRSKPAPEKPPAGSARLLEKELPCISEQAAAIALGGFRSLTRAPEAKMLLLTPVILVVVFGGMFFRQSMDVPDNVRPLMALGGMAMVLFSMVQIVGNQFGFDRSGFRVFVLSPAPRKDILVGKNLSIAPLAVALSAVAVILVQIIYPMRVDHLLALVPQFISMYLLFCLLANLLSIFAPMATAPGTLKPANTRMVPILLHLGFMLVFPTALAPILLPLGVELLLETLGWLQSAPVCLVLSILECAGVIWVYRLVIAWQGGLLQSRELRILEVVTTKAE